MAETKQIPTVNELRIAQSTMTLKCRYVDDLCDLENAFVADVIQSIDYLSFIEGEVGILYLSSTVGAFVDENGDLILIGLPEEILNKSIDPETGELLCDETVVNLQLWDSNNSAIWNETDYNWNSF